MYIKYHCKNLYFSEAEFTALGPRFRHLADMFGGQDEDDSDVDSLYIGGEFVI